MSEGFSIRISDVASGDFTVVGKGIDPQGRPEGFVAFLSTPACDDGADNDGDGPIDHPADPGCSSPVDWSESPDCADGLDNDRDGDVDHPADDGCVGYGVEESLGSGEIRSDVDRAVERRKLV